MSEAETPKGEGLTTLPLLRTALYSIYYALLRASCSRIEPIVCLYLISSKRKEDTGEHGVCKGKLQKNRLHREELCVCIFC